VITTSYDPETGAMFVRFGPEAAKSARTEEVAPGVLIDFDADGQPIGVEVLEVCARAATVRAAAAAE
jgi:uncharacterized protein YuzE